MPHISERGDDEKSDGGKLHRVILQISFFFAKRKHEHRK
jgi:hypothetical protein